MFDSPKRIWLLLVYLLIALPAVIYGAVQAMSANANSPLDWVPASFKPRAEYSEFCDSFGSGDLVIMSWPGCTVDDAKLDQLELALRTAPGFLDPNGKCYFERVLSGRDIVARLTAEPLSLSPTDAAQRLQGTFVGKDGISTYVAIAFRPDAVAMRGQLVPLIRLAAMTHCHIKPEDWHAAGPIMDGLAVDRASKRSLDQLAAPSAAFVFCLCCYFLRSIRCAITVFGASLFAQGATLALVHYSGATMSALLIIMPPLVQVLSVATGIHLMNYYFDALKSNEPRPAERCFQLGWLPCLLSAATTTIGLASLMASRLEPIQQFGGFAATGALLAAALVLFLTPGVLILWPLARNHNAVKSAPSNRPDAVNIVMRYMTAQHGLVSIALLATLAVMGYGLCRVQTSVRIETLFAPGSRIVQDYQWIEQHVAAVVPIEVVLQCDESCPLDDSQRWEILSHMDRLLKAMPEVSGTFSAVSLLPSVPLGVEVSQEELRQLQMEMLSASWNELVSGHLVAEHDGKQKLRLTAFVSSLNDLQYGILLDDIRDKADQMLEDQGTFGLPGISVRCTGIMPLVHMIQDQLMSDLCISFASAFVVIALVMILVLGGVGAGLVAMVPNIFPVVILFGTLGWCGISLDIGSVMTASVALGVAVDDTLHFLTFFQRGLDDGLSRPQAVAFAYRHCAKAMIQTTLTCGLGMLLFTISDFVPTCRFAWMMSTLLAIALIGDLLLLPSLLLGPLGTLFHSDCRVSESSASELASRAEESVRLAA